VSKNKIDFNVLEQAYNSAPMTETMKVENKKKKNKLITIPEEWEIKIKNHYKGTTNSYILVAIFERMQKDGII
jgi:hypothetical protein